MKSTSLSRKHSLESSDGLVSDESSISKRRKRSKGGKTRTIRLADIAQCRYSQERPQHAVLQHQRTDNRPSRGLKKTTSLPTIIHSKAVSDTTDNESDKDVISSSEEEICVASSPNVARRIRQTSDSVEIAKKMKRSRNGKYRKDEDQLHEEVVHATDTEEGPMSSSPTTAASQRPRSYSQSTSASGVSSRASLSVSSNKRKHQGSVLSRTTDSTARTGVELAKLLTDGGDSDLEEVLDDLSENQMKKLHQQLEDRLKRLYGVKPVKKKKRT